MNRRVVRLARVIVVTLNLVLPIRLLAQDSTFLLSTTDPHRSPSPFIGNGRLGVVIPPLGIGATPTFLAGLYENAPTDVPRIVGLPSFAVIGIHDGNRWLDPDSSGDRSIERYSQAVDMRTGAARTSYDWIDGDRRTSLDVESFVSRADSRLAALRLRVTPHHAGPVRVRVAILGWPPPTRLALATIERAQPDWKPADLWYPGQAVIRARSAVRRPTGARLSMESSPVGRPTIVAQAAGVTWDRRDATVSATSRGDTAMVEVVVEGRPEQPSTFTLMGTVATSTEGVKPMVRASRDLDAAMVRGYQGNSGDNAAAWARRWQTDIVIEGNPELQRIVRSMLFYLLCSADSGAHIGIPPMGLSSAGYYGHIFWDSDTWMFPSLLLTHPDIARSLVGFRARTLGAALDNARANGFRGAMYPWEADEQGHETTPHFAVQNARSEIHVTGDVAQAQWQYYLATRDSVWLAREGFPVIRATAEFWASRATRDTTADRYHIANVVSVSEGLIGVTDDAYTNAVARKTLEIATLASHRLGRRADPKWEHIASKLHLPFDSTSGFYRTYEGAPDSTLGDVTPLLAYPLGLSMSAHAKRAHLDQAVRQLLAGGEGAMMGSTLLSVGAAELGDRGMIDSLLLPSYRPHLKGPFLMLSETPTNDAVDFLTGAGGFLQQVIYGYTGLRFGSKGVEPKFPPILPSSVTRLVLRNVSIGGRRWDVTVDSRGRRIISRLGETRP
jgi:trehalose/maltose hydrolase-like predicted phosphorylase